MTYQFQEIEKKWRRRWEKEGIFNAKDFSSKKNFYALVEFPYPSGEGLHVGHCRSYTAMDVIARKRRMEGNNVLFPIGWDAFGLPAENYALKTGVHPRKTTETNIASYKEQMKRLALSFDWEREIDTTDRHYYKWTQWIFLQLLEKGLAYKERMPINWCLSCKIGLANEEVVDGKCERCGGEIEKRNKEQWMIKITEYADRLLSDLEKVDYPEKIKAQQRDWIGRSEGALLNFQVNTEKGLQESLEVFTTRPDTVFGATYLVLAPEHNLVEKLKDSICNWSEVSDYVDKAKKKTDMERTSEEKEKTGKELRGVKAINPANGEKIPVFVADYILVHYGSAAIMAVPAHDARDFDFAKKFDLPIRTVIKSKESERENEVYEGGEGVLINSKSFNGMDSPVAREKILDFVGGKKKTIYKLRDWVFSRQRYWGEPIPVIHCDKCGIVPVSKEDLPVKLPQIKRYEPTDAGESPLANAKKWVEVSCPRCGEDARRETDVMPNWAGSNWYYIRYCDPKNDNEIASMDKLKQWMPVDWYNGGMEHTTLHLLYSRFIYKFLYDIGAVPHPEPYAKRTSHGVVLSEDGSKMSKSKGNVVNPNEMIEKYGADTLRTYEMFMGDFEKMVSWDGKAINGVHRFLKKVWEVTLSCKDREESEEKALAEVHKLNKKVDERIERMKFNTAVSALMEFINFASANKKEVGRDVVERMLVLLSPFAPFMAEELWEKMGHKESIFYQSWPEHKKEMLEDKVVMAVQVNGKFRYRMEVDPHISEEDAKREALSQDAVKRYVQGKEIKKVIFVPKKMINIVLM